MASIDKRGNGFRVRWRTLAGDSRSRQCPNKETAKALGRDIEEQLALGRDWEPTPAEAPVPDVSLEGLIVDWLKNRQLEISVSWHRTLTITWDTLLDALTAAHPGAVITPDHLTTQALRTLYQHCLTVRRNSFDTAVSRVRAIEADWRLMFESEEFDVPPPRRLRLKRPPPTAHPAPTWAQMDAVLTACLQDEGETACKVERFRLLFLARATGLRHSQIAGLEWRDINLETATLTIRGELGKSRQERRGRIVPVPAWAIAELAGWGKRQGRLVGGGVREEAIHRVWIAAGVDADVWKRRPVHAFRHGVTTGLRAAGGEEALVGHLVGHASGTTTGEVYTDWVLLEDRLRAVTGLNPAPQIGKVIALVRGGEKC